MRASALLGAVPGFAAQFREVPQSYWRIHGQGGKVRVECPCGWQPTFTVGFHRCRSNGPDPHRCERLYCFSGRRVVVAGPKS